MMGNRKIQSVCCIALLGLSALDRQTLADWPNFRGPRHDGISPQVKLNTDWSKPIPLVWEKEIGSAFSSFAAVGNQLFTCGTRNDEQVLYAMNANDGKTIWESPIEKAYRDRYGDGTRATPTVDDGRVYIQGAHGRLLCVDAKNGKEIWSRQFSHPPTWGYSGSVLVEGDWVIATPGNDAGSLVAFDKRTGKKIWQVGTDPPGYGTPYPFMMGGRRFIVGFTGTSAIIANAKTGELALRIPWATAYSVNAAAPIFHEDHLFLTSGYDTGCALLKLALEGDRLTHDVVWRSKVIRNKFQSCILYEGSLYTSDQKAFKCVDFSTGQQRWALPGMKHGTIVLAQGHLLVLTEKGELQIGPVSPEGFVPNSQASILTGRCWSVPVIHQGKLYARNLTRVVCIDLNP